MSDGFDLHPAGCDCAVHATERLAAAEARAEELASINRELVEAHNTLLARISKSDVRAEAAERKVAAVERLHVEFQEDVQAITNTHTEALARKGTYRDVVHRLRAALDTAADRDTPTPTRWEVG